MGGIKIEPLLAWHDYLSRTYSIPKKPWDRKLKSGEIRGLDGSIIRHDFSGNSHTREYIGPMGTWTEVVEDQPLTKKEDSQ